MRLVTFSAKGADRLGLVSDGAVLDVAAADEAQTGRGDPAFASMLALIEAGPDALAALRELERAAPRSAWLEAGSYRLRPPLPLPPQMRDSLCFEKHLHQAIEGTFRLRAEMQGADPQAAVAKAHAAGQLAVPPIFYQQPIYYKANRFSICGPDEEVIWPDYSTYMDYECELACIIGKGGKDIPKSEARSHIFGFTIFNDLSARDAQATETVGWLGPAKGKDFDKANVLGPCIVTIDEIGDVAALEMIVRINGHEMSRGSAGEMYWSFEDVIAWISRGETLHPGEIIGSGTVGDGCGLEHSRFLKHGDVVELEVPPIGVLRTRILRKEE